MLLNRVAITKERSDTLLSDVVLKEGQILTLYPPSQPKSLAHLLHDLISTLHALGYELSSQFRKNDVGDIFATSSIMGNELARESESEQSST